MSSARERDALTELHRAQARALRIGAVSLVADKLAASVFLPALPTIALAFGVSHSAVQYLVSVFLVGIAMSELVLGPMSDAIGRRAILMVLAPVYVAGAVLSAVSWAFPVLLIGVFLQGFAIGSVFTITQAIVSETMGRDRTTRALALVAVAGSYAAAAGAVIGGYLTQHLEWQACFWFLAAVLAAISVIYATLPSDTRTSTGMTQAKDLVAAYRALTANPRYRSNVAVVTFLNVGLFAFYALSPFIVIHERGLDPHEYGILMLIPMTGFAIGRFLCAQAARQTSNATLLQWGTLVAVAGGLAMTVAYLFDALAPWVLMTTMALYLAGMGVAAPTARSGAMYATAGLMASSASLLSVTVNAVGSATTGLAAHLPDSTLSVFVLTGAGLSMAVVTWARVRQPSP